MRRVRPAGRADLQRLAQIDAAERGRGRDAASLASELELAWARLEVLEQGAEVVGFVLYWLLPDGLELHAIAVDPAYRRQGCGARLMEHVVAQARGSGAERVLLEVRAGNQEAVRLYERSGLRECGRRPGYYSDGEDAVLMELRLA